MPARARPGTSPTAVVDRFAAAVLFLLGCNSTQPAAPPTAAPESPVAAPSPAPADPPEIHGELRTIDGIRVLRVWGSPAQMGHAHGALLRESILEVIDGYALDVIPPATLDAAGAMYSAVARIPPRLKEEVEGVIAGMRAAGGADVPRLRRELRAADLLVLNAMTDLLAIGCSSVSAWGPGTDAAPGLLGAPVMVRNLDWSDDPQLLANQVVLVFQPDDPRRQPVVSVAFAGYIGCLSCMNEAGVSALFNMGYGAGAASPARALQGFAPANLLLRDALEQRDVDGDGATTADDIEAVWHQQPHAGSYILHLLEPRRPGVPAPARVLEVEADGMAVRTPAPDPLAAHLLAATNHLRAKSPPSPCSRYAQIERTATARSHRFDHDTLWQLGRALRLPDVVHTLLVEPETRRLGLWLRKPGQPPDAHDAPIVLDWPQP